MSDRLLRVGLRSAIAWGLTVCCCATSPAQGVPIGQNLSAQMRWLQLSIVGGRLTLLSDQVTNLNETQSRLRDRQERLQVGVTDGLPSVHYELTAKDVELTIDVSHRDRVELRRRSRGAEPPSSLEFVQPSSGDLSLEISLNGQTERRTAPTLWHLWLAEPELCRKNLAPLLQILHPGWKPDASAEQIAKLLLTPGEDSTPRAREWETLVAQLADPQYATREAADRRLREAGQAVLPYLTRLDARQLDAEQRFRIRRIVGRLQTDSEEDTPDRTAAWLRSDPRIWIALARNPEAATREAAAKQLKSLLGPEVDFDPAADPAVRETQLTKIAERVSKAEQAAATESAP